MSVRDDLPSEAYRWLRLEIGSALTFLHLSRYRTGREGGREEGRRREIEPQPIFLRKQKHVDAKQVETHNNPKAQTTSNFSRSQSHTPQHQPKHQVSEVSETCSRTLTATQSAECLRPDSGIFLATRHFRTGRIPHILHHNSKHVGEMVQTRCCHVRDFLTVCHDYADSTHSKFFLLNARTPVMPCGVSQHF